MAWYWFVIILAAAVAVLILWKKGIITVSTIGQMSEAALQVESMAAADSSLSRLAHYCYLAFHAAEQLAKTGAITAEERKQTATALVAQYAAVDGVTLTETDLKAADTLIEANCDLNGHKTDAEPEEA